MADRREEEVRGTVRPAYPLGDLRQGFSVPAEPAAPTRQIGPVPASPSAPVKAPGDGGLSAGVLSTEEQRRKRREKMMRGETITQFD